MTSTKQKTARVPTVPCRATRGSVAKRKKANHERRPITKSMRTSILNVIATEITNEYTKAEIAKKSKHGIKSRIMEKHRVSQPWITREILAHYLRKTKNSLTNQASDPLDIPADANGPIETLSLSSNSSISNETAKTSLSKGGRPKGTTIESNRDLQDRIVKAKNFAAAEFEKAQLQRRREGKKRVANGTYEQIIADASARFSLPNSVKLSKETARTRTKEGRQIVVAHVGSVSPMSQVEAHLLDIILKLAAMNQPITPTEGLALANSLIEGKSVKEKLKEWKKKHIAHQYVDEESTILTKKYWRNFFQRHERELSAKNAVRFDSKRDDWCNLRTFSQMYDKVYEAMVDCGVAIKLDEPRWFNKDGQIVETENEAYGRKTNYMLIHPEKVFFVDECGDNTSQKNDGNAGGQKFLVDPNQQALIRSAFDECHFTVLGFTAATGQPLCCAVIIACRELHARYVTGVNPFAEVIGDESIFDENQNGLDKLFPLGPSCEYNGQVIPCFVGCSENGSITSKLLTDMMKHIEEYAKFDRTDGYPFLLLDGHGSRFEEQFLEFINSPEHKWKVCIGVPYGTHLWQVGDSKEQNGSFKCSSKKIKAALVQTKADHRMECKLLKSDVVPLVRKAWDDSFGRVAQNKRAVAERGWYPLNHILLDHPDLQKSTNAKGVRRAYERLAQTGHAPIDVLELNTETGIAGTLMDKLIERKSQERGRDEAHMQTQNQRAETAKRKMETAKRLTAGIYVAAGYHELGEVALKKVKELNQQKKDKELATAQKKDREELAMHQKVEAVRQKGNTPASWDVKDLKVMVSWFKRPGDSRMPTTKDKLMTRYEQTKHRSENDRTCLKPGEEAVIDVADGERNEAEEGVDNN